MPRCPIVPRHPIPMRLAAVTAAALVGVMLPALTSCRPAPTTTPTRSPITRPSSRTTPTTTARDTAVFTPSASATLTPQATLGPSVPAPVSMTLDEAKAEALSWFDASRSPRVEWAGYVAREVIGAGLEDGLIDDAMTSWYRSRPISELSAVGVVVVASTFGLSMPLDAANDGKYSPCDVDGCGGDDAARERVVTVFDALTGGRFATMPQTRWVRWPNVVAWQAEPPPNTVQVRRPTVAHPTAAPTIAPTRSLTSVATPDAPPLQADNVPVPMREVLAAYPLLPGSRWTWRVTSCWEGVWWHASELTEVVEAAWVLADDRVAVRSRRSTKRLSGVSWPGEGDAASDVPVESIWRTVVSDGTVRLGIQTGPLGSPGVFDECCSARGFALPLEPWDDPSRPDFGEGANFTTSAHTSVATLAGRFTDCGTIYVIGGNGHGTHRAVCRGVGYVRSESVAMTQPLFAIESMELVDYDVVLPR